MFAHAFQGGKSVLIIDSKGTGYKEKRKTMINWSKLPIQEYSKIYMILTLKVLYLKWFTVLQAKYNFLNKTNRN